MELLRAMSFWAGVLVLSVVTARQFHVFVETNILFRPKRLAPDYSFRFEGVQFQEHTIEADQRGRLHLLHFAADTTVKRRGLVLYTHGNADNLQRWGREAHHFTAHGYDVVMWDYRGFGKSRGALNEPLLLSDAERVYDYARLHVTADDLILYGRSLGTGLSTYLAAHRPCRALALETPYTNLNAMTRQWMPGYPDAIQRYHLRQDQWLARVQVPIVIVHGTADEVVPYAMGAQLAQDAQARGQRVRLVTIAGGNHKQLPERDEWQEAIRSLLH